MNQRNVFVADALDVVLAKAVVEHRRAFERLDGHDLCALSILEVVARSERARRTRSRNVGREVAAGVLRDVVEDRFHRWAGDRVVPNVVRELAELIENDVGRIE